MLLLSPAKGCLLESQQPPNACLSGGRQRAPSQHYYTESCRRYQLPSPTSSSSIKEQHVFLLAAILLSPAPSCADVLSLPLRDGSIVVPSSRSPREHGFVSQPAGPQAVGAGGCSDTRSCACVHGCARGCAFGCACMGAHARLQARYPHLYGSTGTGESLCWLPPLGWLKVKKGGFGSRKGVGVWSRMCCIQLLSCACPATLANTWKRPACRMLLCVFHAML